MACEVFNEVWFTPKRKLLSMKLLAYDDKGVLTVHERSIDFRGRTTTLTIEDIRGISFGKHGRDFVNDWVKVEFFDGATLQTACFADGSQIGWGGVLGGTKRMFEAMSRILQN